MFNVQNCAIKAQQNLKTLARNVTSAMFQNKKLKRNTTSAIAKVAKVALCAYDCALPTSGYSNKQSFSLPAIAGIDQLTFNSNMFFNNYTTTQHNYFTSDMYLKISHANV